MSNLHSKLEELIEPLVQSLGYIYWGIELVLGGNKPTLRVFVDADKGITVDECGDISREIGATLDVANVPEGEYILEVSSPGLDRILFTLDQCRKMKGSEVTVVLVSAIEGRRRYKGELVDVQDDAIIIGDADTQLRIPFHKAKRIRVVPQF